MLSKLIIVGFVLIVAIGGWFMVTQQSKINNDKEVSMKSRGTDIKEFSKVQGPSLGFNNKEYDLGMNKLKSQNNKEIDGHTQKVDGHNGNGFKSISSSELSTKLKNKDFVLIDVHIPEQRHIPGTDYMIAYDNIDKITSVIPNKNLKVILYCRSGSMSKRVAQALVEKGYTNVVDLSNGLNGWIAENKPTVPKGSIKKI